MLTATGVDEEQVVSRLVEVAALVYDEVTSVGFVVEQAKRFAFASNRQLANRLGKIMGRSGGEVVDSVKRLGVDHWWDPKAAKMPVRRSRMASGLRRANSSNGQEGRGQGFHCGRGATCHVWGGASGSDCRGHPETSQVLR